VLSLAHEQAVPERVEQALGEYQRRTTLKASYDLAESGDGAAVVLSPGAEALTVVDWLSGGGAG
jgi:hypothetical protein